MRFTWKQTDDGEFAGYESTRRLSTGHTAWFGANEFLADDGVTIQWDIEIEVFRKRKRRDLFSCELTGPGGTEAPGFFLEALSFFEREIARPGERIQVTGADGKRYRLYHRVLGKRGYLPTRVDGQPTLVKVQT